MSSRRRNSEEPQEHETTATRTRSVFREYLEALLIALLFLRFANTFVVQTFYIPSGSMEETLLVGDRLFVNRFVYGETVVPFEEDLLPLRDIRRGDIVIFRSPESPTVDLVKRCIGLPGDTIEVRNKVLYVNGDPVDDSAYAVHKDPNMVPDISSLPEELRKRDQFGPVTVPEGEYFCMGDNRDRSYDSRFWGTVPAKYVKGRAFMIYWSYAGQASEGGDDPGREDPSLDFPLETRWNRTFQIIR